MPAPTTNEELLDLVRKSGVLDPRLQAHMERLHGDDHVPTDPVSLATVLVRDGLLTNFQAEQFLQGKWRRFTIGKYKVLERLGQGGMGSVYLCEHMLMRRRVAVKVLPEAKSDTSSLERFYREARAVAALDHPNIVRAYDIDQDDKLHFLVMEHVDGASLQEIIKKTGPMDATRAAHYMRQAALGLQHAHETAALVHRDIKPGNILVDRNGIVKVLDMGLARFFHDDTDELTKKYDENVLGTADYLAPEQALDSHTADIRADVYSLGGTFYFCLTARTPFAEGSVAQKLIWHQTRNPKPIASLRPEVPADIIAVIDKMMLKDKNARYQTPLDVADALAPFTQTPIPPPPDAEMPQFSLAARSSPGEPGAQSSSRSVSDTVPVPPPAPRKAWQVNAPSQDNNAPRSPAPRPAVAQATPSPGTTRAPAKPGGNSRLPASPSNAPAARAKAPATPPARKTNRAVQTMPQPAIVTHEVTEEHLVEEHDVEAIQPPRGMKSARRALSALEAFRSYPAHVRWLVIAVALLLPLCLLLLYLLMGSGGKTARGLAREPIRVPPGPNALRQALKNARDGDHLLLCGDIIESNVAITRRNLVIEPEQGRRVTWRCPGNAGADSKLLLVGSNAAGLQLRGLTLDGGGKTEALVILFGQCPGARFENLELKNSRKYDLLIMSGEGSEESPVEFVDVVFQTTAGQSAVRFDFQKEVDTVKINRFFTFPGCRFEGAGHKITTANPACVDASTLALPEGVKVERVPLTDRTGAHSPMPFPMFDRSRLLIQPLSARAHDLDLSALLPLDAEADFDHPAMPILARRLLDARQQGRARILMMGAHLIRAGVARQLIDLMERGLISHVAMNGAGPIHDWEFALIGATTESVARYIRTGEFGLWRETGRMNDVVRDGARQGIGLGECLGKAILEGDFPHKEISVLAAGVRLGVPVTVHVGIGQDILHEHPNCDGAAFGATSYTDFLVLTHAVARLEGGVMLNFGTAVMGPEVYLKALAMARNVARQDGQSICHFTTAVFDLIPLDGDTRQQAPKSDPRYYYRPWKTILVRTVADGGESFYIQGDHRQTVPRLYHEARHALSRIPDA